MTLEDHAEELASDLGVDKAEVKEDLENLVAYSVPMDEAKQSLRRKYGSGESQSGEPSTKELASVTPEDTGVTVTAVVLTVGKRSIRYQGDDHVIYEGELADESGRLSYTAWEDFDLEPGQTVKIGNAGVREWEGEPELNLGERTAVEVVDETLDIDADIGGYATLATLSPGDRGVTVEAVVEEVERKVIDGRDGETEILSGVLADDSGRLPFTDWDPHDVVEADATLKIENAFIREFRGVASVNISEFSRVEKLDKDIPAPETAPEYSIGEAIEVGGLFDVQVTGNVLSIREGSGLIERCPECGRVVQNGQCRSHGTVDGEDDLRTKAVVDDGTGALTVVLDKELTASVYGGDLEDATEHAREAMDRDVVAEDIRSELVGWAVKARGSLTVDDYGANLEATEFDELENDPTEAAEQFLAEVEK